MSSLMGCSAKLNYTIGSQISQFQFGVWSLTKLGFSSKIRSSSSLGFRVCHGKSIRVSTILNSTIRNANCQLVQCTQ